MFDDRKIWNHEVRVNPISCFTSSLLFRDQLFQTEVSPRWGVTVIYKNPRSARVALEALLTPCTRATLGLLLLMQSSKLTNRTLAIMANPPQIQYLRLGHPGVRVMGRSTLCAGIAHVYRKDTETRASTSRISICPSHA